jgi:hypothetical protein
MAYNRRDLFAHWVRREQPSGKPCTHACCRGYRSHPEGYPVVLPARVLRGATDNQLDRHYHKCDDAPSSAKAERCRAQVLGELNRRDMRDKRRADREKARQRRYSARRNLRETETERIYLDAERETKGYMLNRRGREAGIDERTLLRGPESRVRKYGSEELLNYFEDNPRPTEAYFRGDDTRLGRTGMRGRLTSQESRERHYYEDLEERERLSAASARG